MATVLRAKTAGFCMGVGLALRKLDQALKEHRARSSGRLVSSVFIADSSFKKKR